jgi:hypothetical protein
VFCSADFRAISDAASSRDIQGLHAPIFLWTACSYLFTLIYVTES